MDFSEKLSKLRSKKNVMVDGQSPTQESMYIDSQGNQTEEEVPSDGDIADFYKPENVTAREMLSFGINLFLANLLGRKK